MIPSTMGRVIAILGLVLLVPMAATAGAGQRRGRPTVKAHGPPATPREIDEQNRAVNQLHAAAEAYRSGDLTTALARLDAVPGQSDRAHAVALWLRTTREARKAGAHVNDSASGVEVRPWDVPLARALGALEMEFVLRGYRERDRRPAAETMTAALAAESLFGAVEEEGEPYAGSRWEAAIALTAFGEGQIGWVSQLIEAPCREPDADADVMLACGALHGVLAAQPADVLTATVQESGPRIPSLPPPSGGPGMPAPDLSAASAPSKAENIRRDFADRAARELDGLLHSDSRSAEARLRGASALIAVHNDTAGARLLEPLETANRLDARTTYLTALFLGGIRARAGKADIAAALFERAIAAMPSGQSAFVALADVERARGNAGAAAAAIERMFGAPSTPPDPWAEFAFGPYWLAPPLLQDLRAEVRR